MNLNSIFEWIFAWDLLCSFCIIKTKKERDWNVNCIHSSKKLKFFINSICYCWMFSWTQCDYYPRMCQSKFSIKLDGITIGWVNLKEKQHHFILEEFLNLFLLNFLFLKFIFFFSFCIFFLQFGLKLLQNRKIIFRYYYLDEALFYTIQTCN